MDFISIFLTRPTIIVALLGMGSAFFLEKVYLLLAMISLIAVHLVFSILSANKSYGYETYRRCFYDVVADLIIYTLTLLFIFAWYIVPFYVTLSAAMTTASYYFVLAFLIVTSVIKLAETVITVRNCLIAMERLNPISITGVGK